MKLPWVSRLAYDSMAAGKDAQFDRIYSMHNTLQDKYSDLLDKYHALKLQGAVIPPVAQPQQPASPDQIIARAIDSIPASRDPKNRARMWAQVNQDRAARVSDEEIIMRIQRGNRPAEETA